MRDVALFITLCDMYTTGYNAYYTQLFYITARGSPFEGGGGGVLFLFVGARYYIPTSKYFQFFKSKFDKSPIATCNVVL